MPELPSWCTPLPDGTAMRATDKWAIESGAVGSLELMERAGRGLAELAARVIPEGPVVVVCGKGNNGGDGYVAARLLRDGGREVRVLSTVDVGELEGDAKANLDALSGDAPQPFAAGALAGAGGVVDAILGTGFSGAPRGVAGEAIAALNDAGLPVVAADVPSGVDASSGEVVADAVRCVATATFHRAKPGLWIRPGKAHAGEVTVIDIGIPDGAPVDPPQIGLVGGEVLALLARRVAESTKFSGGHVLVAGGSRGMTGALMIACEAAGRAGAGYVTCAVPETLDAIVETRLLEPVILPVAGNDAHGPQGVQAVLDAAEHRGGALVLGPGIGRSDGAVEFARALAARAEIALLLDADGLNAHAGRLESLAEREAPTVLTPHAGELARLLEVESKDVEAKRLEHVREAARRSGSVVVLKGDDTLVADPDGRVGVSRGGAPGLATAGTGDVLAGVTGAILASGAEPFAAACAAVRLHRDAGRIAAEPHGPTGVIASDVIAALRAASGGRD